jgi:4-amino-4-deoxy-L-arabinose transferase-like glycosyltransferase
MLVQIAASVATVWLILWIARETLDERTANLAGAFWAISPPLLFIPTIFWETSLSAGSLVATIALALRCQRQPSIRVWTAMGAASGVIGLINPALLPSLLAILGWTAWQTRKSARTAPLLGFAALLLVFSPWPIRNAVRFHAFIPTRTTVGFELWMGNRPGSNGYLDESIFPMYNKAELASYIAKGELAYTQDKTELAERYIREYPAVFLKMTMRRVFRFWTGTGNQTGSAVYAIHAILTSSLGLIGIILLYRRRMYGFATLMILPLLIFPLPYYITHAEFRYRLNIDPILTILAAYAVTHLANRSDEAQAT